MNSVNNIKLIDLSKDRTFLLNSVTSGVILIFLTFLPTTLGVIFGYNWLGFLGSMILIVYGMQMMPDYAKTIKKIDNTKTIYETDLFKSLSKSVDNDGASVYSAIDRLRVEMRIHADYTKSAVDNLSDAELINLFVEKIVNHKTTRPIGKMVKMNLIKQTDAFVVVPQAFFYDTAQTMINLGVDIKKAYTTSNLRQKDPSYCNSNAIVIVFKNNSDITENLVKLVIAPQKASKDVPLKINVYSAKEILDVVKEIKSK